MPIIIWKRPHVRIPLEVVLLDSALLYVIGLTYKRRHGESECG
ncbi:hypothetical protein T01_13679 [Trichinella spiralis]|uniref:Uncharacterized protein n=1 Tax=Trichinella spiralis TaxID=6334 RepID=A0A0V1AIM1_TRISP|nr:hypothetical protein T01_13679 [Trichinella spiralis]